MQRLHPLTLVQRFLRSLPGFAFLLLPVIFGSSNRSNAFSLVLVVIYGLFTLPLIILQYLRFAYRLTPRELVIQSGVVTRRKRNIPIEKIQNVEIEQSLLPRLMGMAKVKVETAGSQSTEGVLEYVGLDEAQRIRATVRAFQRAGADVQSGPSAPPVEPGPASEASSEAPAPRPDAEPATRLLFTMPFGRVLLAGAFRFSLLYLAVIFSILQQFDLNEIAERFANWIARGRFQPYLEIAEASPVLTITLAVFVTALLGWVTGIAITVLRYANFRLWLEDDKLYKKSGLLTVSEGTIPLGKVQALILRSNPLMRAFGWYRLELQTMGYDVSEQGHQIAVPFAQYETILALAPHIHPFSLPSSFAGVSRLHIRRLFVRYAVLLLVVVLPVAYFWRPVLWALALLPVALAYAFLQYRNHGYALGQSHLFVRRGVLSQHLWVLPHEKMQVFYASRSLFQRRLSLTTLLPDMAGASALSAPAIQDLPDETAAPLFDRLYAAFQHCFSGDEGRAVGEEGLEKGELGNGNGEKGEGEVWNGGRGSEGDGERDAETGTE